MTLRAFLVLIAATLLIGCGTIPKQELSRFEFEEPQMGVPFRIVLYAPDQKSAEAAVDKAYARVAYLNTLMSDYEYESELNRLGRTSGSGQKVEVSPELWTVLKKAQEVSQASHGAFDVSVAPLIQLWRKARREKQLPAPEAIENAKARVGYQNILMRDHAVELKAPNMRLDLGAIAKGYSADEALRILRENGFRQALCAASGDMALGDAPPGKKGWTIELLNTTGTNKTSLTLKNCGLATSGDLFQFVEIGGKRYSHIVDPKTGLGLTDRSLVTVIAKDGITADALSTTISVIGPGRGLKIAEKFGAKGRVLRTSENGTRVEAASDGFWEMLPER
jgi:thiamine biosynthesis lipoprotein